MACSDQSEVVICRKHPNDENPQPGVCPSCLRERLSKIAAGNSKLLFTNTNYYYYCSSNSPSVSVYYYGYSRSNSASSSGGCSSPAVIRRGHQRVASDVLDSIYLAISGNISNGLKKSRSMAFASINIGERNHGVVDRKKKKKKKGGFWNKLLLRF